MGLEMIGLDDLVRTIVGMEQVDEAKALDKLARKVEAEAVKRAPRDTGFLRSSSRVDKSTGKRTIRFTSEYALAQHEKTEWQHDHGRSKYLESALIDVVSAEASDVLGEMLSDKGFD